MHVISNQSVACEIRRSNIGNRFIFMCCHCSRSQCQCHFDKRNNRNVCCVQGKINAKSFFFNQFCLHTLSSPFGTVSNMIYFPCVWRKQPFHQVGNICCTNNSICDSVENSNGTRETNAFLFVRVTVFVQFIVCCEHLTQKWAMTTHSKVSSKRLLLFLR